MEATKERVRWCIDPTTPDRLTVGRPRSTTEPEYEIRVKGALQRHWWDWFGDYAINVEPSGETTLSARITDQRSLIGAIVTLHDLGYALISVTPARPRSSAV